MTTRQRTIGTGAVQTDLVDGPETARADMVGGTPGVLVDEQASKTIHTGNSAGKGYRENPDAPEVVVKEFRVRVGGHVMLDGIRVPMRVGKIVSAVTYDLKKLLMQGIVLDPIETTPPDPPPFNPDPLPPQ